MFTTKSSNSSDSESSQQEFTINESFAIKYDLKKRSEEISQCN